MNRKTTLILVMLALGLSGAASAQAASRDPTHPAIAHYGAVQPRPNAAEQPNPNKHYQVVFDVRGKSKAADKPNTGLAHIAHAVNAFASAGVPLDHLDFVAVIRGGATSSVLTNAAYAKQVGGEKNPNTGLITALHKAGVKLEVCGQALSGKHYRNSWVNKNVTITLAGIPDLAIYGNRGYTIIQP